MENDTKLDSYVIEGEWDNSDLLPFLRTSIVHITCEKGYFGIMKSGKIIPSRSKIIGPFKMDNHCGRFLGNICLLDTIDVSDSDIILGLEGLTLVGSFYYLFFDEVIRPKLVRHDFEKCKGHLYCPKVEKGYHGELDLRYVRKILQIVRE